MRKLTEKEITLKTATLGGGLTGLTLGYLMAEITCKAEDDISREKDTNIASQVVDDLLSLNVIDKRGELCPNP